MDKPGVRFDKDKCDLFGKRIEMKPNPRAAPELAVIKSYKPGAEAPYGVVFDSQPDKVREEDLLRRGRKDWKEVGWGDATIEETAEYRPMCPRCAIALGEGRAAWTRCTGCDLMEPGCSSDGVIARMNRDDPHRCPPPKYAESDDSASVASDISVAGEPQQLPGDACVANATTRVGVFKKGKDNAAAKAALNKQIDPVHSKLSQTNPSLPVSEVGVENQIWHKEVVQRAVIDAGYHFFKVQIDPTHPEQANLRKEFKTGSFLVEGLLNPRWLPAGKKADKSTNWIERYPDEAGPVESNPLDSWWHMTGVKNGKILDWEFAANGDRLDCSADCFWLRDNSTPDPNKGYMRSFRRVYRIEKCTKAKGNCSGCEKVSTKKRKRASQ